MTWTLVGLASLVIACSHPSTSPAAPAAPVAPAPTNCGGQPYWGTDLVAAKEALADVMLGRHIATAIGPGELTAGGPEMLVIGVASEDKRDAAEAFVKACAPEVAHGIVVTNPRPL
jgi:hypothetical protein